MAPNTTDLPTADLPPNAVPSSLKRVYPQPPGYAIPSCGGHGTLEIKEVIEILESNNILCCAVGVSALIYFGAARLRVDWEICVPTEELSRAAELFNSSPHNAVYEVAEPYTVQLKSLYHTFPRFKVRGVDLIFQLIPAEDCHIVCDPENFERSEMGIPYPKLAIYAQSLLATLNIVDLDDLVDGMNLSEDWGLQNLELDGFSDAEWARRKNEKIRASIPRTRTSGWYELGVGEWSLMKTWQDCVRHKEKRIGPELPKELFATRFFAKDEEDPRSTKGRRHC